MTAEEADQLIEKYVNGIASAKEKALVEQWYQKESQRGKLSDDDDFEHLRNELLEQIQTKAGIRKRPPIFLMWTKAAVAASIVIALSFALLFFGKQSTHKESSVTKENNRAGLKYDVLPGSNKAFLTLGNGKKIQLTSASNGRIATDNQVNIDKSADGKLTYQSNNSGSSKHVLNTMTTPRGGQFSITLSDGTIVYLNAASSITYPTDFSGKDRTVKLEGEAYFEVAHNAHKPFKVVTNGQTVVVLGTHFNIKSYRDELIIKTTLLQGSVKVLAGDRTVHLRPGDQSQLRLNGSSSNINVAYVNTDEAIAWKNGFFEFNDASLTEVMQMAARWYDLDVDYSMATSNIKISGSISRSVNLSSLIRLLRFEGAKINVNENRIQLLN